ncbi:hypothetical protein PV797_07140 [Clostridiaceae bacterium M8S5]|nr:hypothetical protein PV797_07140 [Clostridiaceae bacterium M8S5]
MLNKIVLIICAISLVFALVGCRANKSKDIVSEVKIDKIKDSSVVANFVYEELVSNKSVSYLWKDKVMLDAKGDYKRTYANIYPVKSEDKLKDKLELGEVMSNSYGQLMYYVSTDKLELFMYESYYDDNWKVCLLYDDSVKEILIKHESEKLIYSYQLTEEAVYIFSEEIYKIHLDDYSVDVIKIPFNDFNIKSAATRPEQVFIKDNMYIQGTSYFEEINKTTDEQGVFLKFNLKNNDAETIFQKDRVEKIFVNKDVYVVLSSEKNTYKPMLNYYDKDFKLLGSKKIKIESKEGTVTASRLGRFFSLYKDKLYGVMSIDGKHVEEIVVIDVNTAEVLYQMEIQNKLVSKGYSLLEARFYLKQNSKLIQLTSF